MSNIIPPLLSDSPPPMVEAIIEDEDDEFGSFAVSSLSFDDEVLTLPTPQINIKEIPNISRLNSVDKDFQDRRKHDEELNDKFIYDEFSYFPKEVPPNEDTESLKSISSDDHTLVIENAFTEDVTALDNEVQIINKFNIDNLNSPEVIEDELNKVSNDDNDDFADFNAFTSTSTEQSVEKTQSEQLTESVKELTDDTVNDDNDDDYGEFSNYSVSGSENKQFEAIGVDKAKSIVASMFPSIEQQTEDFKEEILLSADSIFTQLKDITDTFALSYQWSKSCSQNFLLQALNIDSRNILYGPRWNETMPRYAATLGFAPLEPMKSDGNNKTNSEASSHIVAEQTEIPKAEFDWVGSGLTNPLEMTPKKMVEKQLELGTFEQINDKKFDVSITQIQASSDNDSIKSLKLIQNTDADKCEGDFDDFSCFQSSNRNENFDSWTTLRETHISNVKVDEPCWLKPTIVTPDLPRKEVTLNKQVKDDEFSDFQTGNVPETKQENVQTDDSKPAEPMRLLNTQLYPILPKYTQSSSVLPSISQSISSQFVSPQPLTTNSSLLQTPIPSVQPLSVQMLPLVPEPLHPVILKPVKIENTPTTINWPNPGVTDEELERFDLFFKPNPIDSESCIKSSTNNVKADEDDWSDFISNQTKHSSLNENNKQSPLGNIKPNTLCSKKEESLVISPLPLPKNGIQTSFVSNQYVMLNHLPSKTEEVEDEWSDFVSSQPLTVPESHSQRSRPSIPKLNLDWNGPPQFTSWSASMTPNIITNPVSFESFQGFLPLDADLLKKRTHNKKNPGVVIQPKKSTVSSIATVPDLEFIAPKNRTWKK
ncbi:hypothetical protein FQA39_LY13814 [Lamprigera yunnana]|nr:hypothetical protein FQA39_LY13814 [Lamprigera yunnana]